MGMGSRDKNTNDGMHDQACGGRSRGVRARYVRMGAGRDAGRVGAGKKAQEGGRGEKGTGRVGMGKMEQEGWAWGKRRTKGGRGKERGWKGGRGELYGETDWYYLKFVQCRVHQVTNIQVGNLSPFWVYGYINDLSTDIFVLYKAVDY